MRATQTATSSLIRNKFFVAVAISVLILSIVFFFSAERFPFSNTQNFTGVLIKAANLGIRDVFLSRFSTNPVANKNIVIVAIDNRSLSDETGLGRFQDYRRSYYARVIDHLHRDGAAVVGVDVLFSEKSADDAILERSIRSAGNVVLGFSLTENLFPIGSLEHVASGLGYFHPKINIWNSSVYGIIPARSRGNETWEAFSFVVLRRYLDALHGEKSTPEVGRSTDTAGYVLRNYSIPYASEDDTEIFINYVPRSSKFETISFSDVYNDTYDRTKVRDKIVLVGSTAAALFDRFNTPLGIQDGVYIHANMINTVLNRSYLAKIDETREIILLILITFFLVFFTLHVNNRIYQLLFAVIGLVIFLFWEYAYFRLFHKLFNYPTELLIIVFFVATSVTGYKYLYEEKGKRLLRNTLSQYLAEDLVLNVLENYEEIRLWGVRREITTFFSDIAGFTTLSENMEPEEIVRFLSTYLRETSDIIMHEHGFINKYEWDAIMALWGAFGTEPRQSELACLAALRQQEKIREMNAHFEKEYGFLIRVRMGINKGIAVVGNIGSEGKKVEYTALGDSVNTASRFEGINKLYGTNICVGASIVEETSDRFVFRKLDYIQVKGKGNPLYIYELVGERASVSESTLNTVARYEEALGLYLSQRFAESRDIFEILSTEDAPSKTMLKRIIPLVWQPYDPDWTGIYQAREK